MKSTVLSFLLLLISLTNLTNQVIKKQTNDPKGFPLIGIMTIPASATLNNEYYQAPQNWSYIPRSYINYVTQTGAMAVLIPFDLPVQTLDRILSNLQGMMFIGGSTSLGSDTNPSFFQKRVSYILQKAIQINDSGTYFPIVATCLGMQSLTVAMSGNKVSLLNCNIDDEDTNHVVTPTTSFSQSKIYTKMN